MGNLRTSIIMTLCILLVTSLAWADKSATVKRIGGYNAQTINLKTTRQDCQVGNLNAPTLAISDWFVGIDSYKFLFDPAATCDCTIGFDLQSVHVFMQFGPEDVPAAFAANVDLAEAVWDDASGCWVPGAEVCTSPVSSITIDTEGLYDIGLPIAGDCACAEMGFFYLLSCHFTTALPTGMEPDAVADDLPTPCTSWYDFGAGWQDLVVDFGWPGNIIMNGDVVCCEFPVESETTSWGGVKSLYR